MQFTNMQRHSKRNTGSKQRWDSAHVRARSVNLAVVSFDHRTYRNLYILLENTRTLSAGYPAATSRSTDVTTNDIRPHGCIPYAH